MNKYQVKGRVTKAKGTAKALAGKVLGKPSLVARGKLQQAAGTLQFAYGDLKSTATKRAAAGKRTATRQGVALEKTVKKTVRKKAKTVEKQAKSATRKATRATKRTGKKVRKQATKVTRRTKKAI